MGRGLSELQLWVLWRAAEQAFVRRPEVLLDYYRLSPIRQDRDWRKRPRRRRQGTLSDKRDTYSPEQLERMGLHSWEVWEREFNTLPNDWRWAQHVSSREGGAHYRSASAATSRAFKRLVRRGYLEPATVPHPGASKEALRRTLATISAMSASEGRRGPSLEGVEEVPPGEAAIAGAYRITPEGYAALGDRLTPDLLKRGSGDILIEGSFERPSEAPAAEQNRNIAPREAALEAEKARYRGDLDYLPSPELLGWPDLPEGSPPRGAAALEIDPESGELVPYGSSTRHRRRADQDR